MWRLVLGLVRYAALCLGLVVLWSVVADVLAWLSLVRGGARG